MKPLLLLTIDVEEDMPGWRITDPITVENARALPVLAETCAELGVRPTYLCSYPMVQDPASRAVLGDLHARGGCEIGTHLHPWNTPPFEGLPDRDVDERSTAYFPCELGAERFRAKLETLHGALAELTGSAPTSHRAGRFGIDAVTLGELVAMGYEVDSSVTPLADHRGDGGPDFRRAPTVPYRPDRESVVRRGDLPIVEIPVSIGLTRNLPRAARRAFLSLPEALHVRGLLSKDYLDLVDYAWLYPARFELDLMKRLLATLSAGEAPTFNVFLHSNELTPGTSGREDRDAHEVCLERTRRLLEHCVSEYDATPVTLTEAARLLEPTLGP